MNKWWGYLHTNGTIHAKRYFDAEDLVEANLSDFVAEVYGPFDAIGSSGAVEILRQHFKGEVAEKKPDYPKPKVLYDDAR